MDSLERTAHWEKVYQTKQLNEVSWYQPAPTTSLEFIQQLKIPQSAKIIDVGGGDSFLVDNLLQLGYRDITVLDISAAAIQRAQARLGQQAAFVKWIIADAATFQPTEQYDVWHDRAAFHFLTDEQEIEHYLKTARGHLTEAGVLIVGTFSENGPRKCSGLEIKQYSEISMAKRLSGLFEKIRCITVDHRTPFDTIQNFVFCSFRKLQVDDGA